MRKFAVIFICVLALFLPSGKAEAAQYTGIQKSANGVWNYYTDGKVDTSYNGLAKYNNNWWYVKNGEIQFGYTGLCKYNGSWWYVSGGKVNFSAKGLCKYNGTWWYIENGKVNFDYIGLCKYNGIWWYINFGKVDFSFTGIAVYGGKAWYVKNGQIDWSYTGDFSFCGAATKTVKGYDVDYKVVNGQAFYKKAKSGDCPYTLYKLYVDGDKVYWYQIYYDDRGLVDVAIDIAREEARQKAEELGYTRNCIYTSGGPHSNVGYYNVGPVTYCEAKVIKIEH